MRSIPRNLIIAGAIAAAVVAWMLTGLWSGSGESDAGAGPDAPSTGQRLTVEFEILNAESIERRIVAQGQVRPERAAVLRAQTAGQVEAVLVESGQRVEAGTVLVRLAMDDREARLREARALLQQREREYEAARRLGETGYQSLVRRDEAEAALAAARAAVERIELDIARTRIRAPFDGVVDERLVDAGDYAAPRTAVLSLVDNDPLIAEAWLSQRHFDEVAPGAPARVTLVSGATREGPVTAVSPRADEASRTFRIEVEVANPGGVPANTSAEIEIPVERVAAHRVSPALLTLDSAGVLGVKTLDDAHRVRFVPVDIVRSDAGGVWVRGLSARARVITAGGGFVTPGESVDAVAPASPAGS